MPRYDPDLRIEDMFPREKGKCSFCHGPLPKYRRFWCSDHCGGEAYELFGIRKGYNDVIRGAVYGRDGGRCASCGEVNQGRWGNWDADHIIAVSDGGENVLENFQTLCKKCHKVKTAEMMKRQAIERKKRKETDYSTLPLFAR